MLHKRTTFIIKNILLLISLFSYIQLLNYPFSGESWFYDLTSRLHLNDVYLHLSHFYWTTLTYLGPFFLLQLSIVILYYNPNNLLLVVVISLVYLTEVGDFLVGNYLVGFTTLNYWDFNNLLTNNLNKYHPHIFYLSTIFCIAIVMLESPYFYFKQSNFISTQTLKSLERLIYLSGSVNIFALFLGSWWAFQEGTWGGWWNWDPSEVLGLLILTTSLIGIHHFVSNTQTFVLLTKLKIGVGFVVLAYFFTQLNFDLVSHNFGNRFTFFFTNTLFYLESALLVGFWIALGLTLTIKKLLHLRVLRTAPVTLIPSYIFSTVLNWIWVWFILTSFLPLCNYFLWQYFHLNLLNISVSHQLTLVYVTLSLYLLFINLPRTNHTAVISLLVLKFPSLSSPPFLLLKGSARKTLLFHAAIIVQIVINSLTNQLDNMSGLSTSLYTPNIVGDSLNRSVVSIHVCEDVWRELFYSKPLSTPTPHLSYSLSTLSNISETNSFTLIQDSHAFVNYYQIANSYIDVNVEIWNPYFVNLYEALLFSLIGFLIWWYKTNYLPIVFTNN